MDWSIRPGWDDQARLTEGCYVLRTKVNNWTGETNVRDAGEIAIEAGALFTTGIWSPLLTKPSRTCGAVAAKSCEAPPPFTRARQVTQRQIGPPPRIAFTFFGFRTPRGERTAAAA
ncbi:MAG: hypothetical protein ABIP62_11670 [Vicinamibacteria bacterium]